MNIYEEAWKSFGTALASEPDAEWQAIEIIRAMAGHARKARLKVKAYKKKIEKEIEEGYKELTKEHERWLEEQDYGGD